MLLLLCRIFGSEEFRKKGWAVFDADFIDECLYVGGVSKVAVGKYFVPSPQLQEGNKDTFCAERSFIILADTETFSVISAIFAAMTENGLILPFEKLKENRLQR